MALDFRILGPLEVLDGTAPVRLGGTKQRAVLALLLLDRNRVVSSDRLIEGLWGERPPEDAPTALQAHVSRLRRALPGGPDVLVTQSPGYLLRVGASDLDADRFRFRVRRGRMALEAGNADQAARLLREGLDLWRGRVLEDLQDEAFVRAATPRLEEEGLEALELRIEADLRLGRHEALVSELGALVQEHPLRERLAAQRMLALYRAGRQADALEAYAETRRVLVAELGLEPGPELQRLQRRILEHDSELLLATARPDGRRLRVVAGVAIAGVLAAALAAVVATLAFGEDVKAVGASAGVVAIDAETGRIRRSIAAGRSPVAVAARGGSVWVVDGDARTVVHVDETSRVVETLSTGATPIDVAVGSGGVWVVNGRRSRGAQFVGALPSAVARFDIATRSQRGETDLPPATRQVLNVVDNHVAVGAGAVWSITADGGVVRIDPATGTRTAVARPFPALAVAAGAAGVWAVGVGGRVARLDPRTARPLLQASIPSPSVGSIAVGADAAWVTSPDDGRVWRIGPGRTSTLGSIDVARGITDVAAGPSGIWVVNPLAGTLTQLDPRRATVVRTLEVQGIPRSVAIDGGTVWLAVEPGPSESASDDGGIRTFAAPNCEPVLSAGDRPDVLIVSDLPLQGDSRLQATQMAQAIAFVLRDRHFRAGRFRVAYQSCDDALARTGLFDEPKCASNARAYARNADVVGVIGTFNSGCAAAALPELNRAVRGPLGMVSPLNSLVVLTRPVPGTDPALPAALYPTGRRNFVRVFPADDLQGAALAVFAKERGHRRVFVLDDGDPWWGAMWARGFETAATRLGLDVVGTARWDPGAAGYAALAERVARARPTAVFAGGLLDTNGARVVRDLRARLGRSVAILVPEGLSPLPLFVEQAGRAAIGTYASYGGVLTDGLPPAGRRFVERFAATQAGVPNEPSAVYAAQAAEVLLDAIARSDGSRSSVTDELFATRVQDGLLGTFGFDANGDITESPVTILRVIRRGTSRGVRSVDGGHVERVVRPAASLVAAGR